MHVREVRGLGLALGESIEIVLITGLRFLPAAQEAMLAQPRVERVGNL